MKIKIERFKNISSIEIELANLTLLIGGNNSGKSSVLQAIQFAISAAQTSETQNTHWNDNRLSTSISPPDLIYSPLRDVYALAPNRSLSQNEADAIKITFNEDGNECVVVVRKGRNKNIFIQLLGINLGKVLQSLDNPFSIIVPGLAGIPSFEEYETQLVVRRAAARGDSNKVFRNILWLLKRSQAAWNEFHERLHTIFPNININVSFDEARDEYIDCTAQVDDNIFPIDSCGTGVLQVVQILSYLSLYRPKILILDEPDSHLHPNNQRKLANILLNLSQTGVKFLVATHSLHMVDSLLDNSEIFWLRHGRLVEGAENSEIRALVDIGALNEGETLRDADFVILSEDEDDRLIKKILEASEFDLAECEIWSYKGCSNINTAKTLIAYIRKHNNNCTIIIHRDRDYMTPQEIVEYRSHFNQNNVHLFITPYNDLEASFCNPDHLHEICPEISIDEATQIWNESFNELKDDIFSKIVNTRIDTLRKNRDAQINAGEISAEYRNLLDENPRDYANGKIMIRKINEKLRQKLGRHQNIIQSSHNIAVTELVDLYGRNG